MQRWIKKTLDYDSFHDSCEDGRNRYWPEIGTLFWCGSFVNWTDDGSLPLEWDYNNNNNNNNQDNVYGAVIMAEPLREFIRFI